MYAIEARGLRKNFKETRAVDGIDLLVERGEIVGLLGPNGAGKTTTILMLLGLIEPDAGSVSLLGRLLPEERTEAVRRTNFWASYLGMPGKLLVREILQCHADLYGAPYSGIEACVERFGIERLLRKFPSQMSSGEKTLVGLARSLVNDPELLILDEPTASLDPEIADRIRRALAEERRERGITMLVTSHNMTDIERLCGRVVFIGAGRVVADAPPGVITERYGALDLEGAFLSIAAEVRG